jgi:cyclic peptide transporter
MNVFQDPLTVRGNSIMELLKILQKRSRWFYSALVLLSVVSGLLNISILTFVNTYVTGLSNNLFPEPAWIFFFSLIILAFFISLGFQRYMIRLTNDILFEFEVSILQKLRNCSYEGFEKVGFEKVLTAISDTKRLATLPANFMSMVFSVTVIVFSFVYLFVISPPGALLVTLIVLSAVTLYLIRNTQIQKELNRLRDIQDDYYSHLNDLLLGFKEVKMSDVRNDNLFQKFLFRNRFESKTISISSSVKYLTNELIGNYGWYAILGIIMYFVPQLFRIPKTELTSFVITILYIMGPLAALVTLIPSLTNIKIAFERLNHFDSIINTNLDREDNQVTQSGVEDTFASFEEISFDEVHYQYYDQNHKPTFYLGPVNLSIARGELIYVVGGNGSGKSTFVKVLTGLYTPTSGKILFNGRPICANDLVHYRNNLSVVFADNYLLSENYDEFDLGGAEFKSLLDRMKMRNVAKVDPRRNIVNRNLSKGQLKRLSMIYALLENHSILILDEWAAEQDPDFRDFFYKEFLPVLRDAGKTIILITHDDAYYPCADRVIRFDLGKVAYDSVNVSMPLAPSS